ncbi:MAG: hypothetical protein KJ601_05970 [Nanoarchaeota archaeon]|nr:hypothetical protein [Nanoarchaeota archaeon]MBU1704695.1 hypothetical protein [Nanoarchaeota archaeon]
MRFDHCFIFAILFLVSACAVNHNKPIDYSITNIAQEPIKNYTESDTDNISIGEGEDSIHVENLNEEPKLIMFHNNQGPMCIEQLSFLEGQKKKFPNLIIEEYLTTEQKTYAKMIEIRSSFSVSKGVSSSFGYLPITFVNHNAYSGFNDEVKSMLEKDIIEVCR